MEIEEDEALIATAKAVAKAKEAYYKEMERQNIDSAYYPISITVNEMDSNFSIVRIVLITKD